MRKHGANDCLQSRNGHRSCLKRCLLLALWLASPPLMSVADILDRWIEEDLQAGGGLAPGIKVLAALNSPAYAWSPDGKRLAYMAADGIWVVEAPDFRQPKLLIREGRGRGGSHQLLWSPNGQKLAFTDSRPADEWQTIWVADADGSHVRDLLPPGTPFSSPDTKPVYNCFICSWLNNREIEFGVNQSGAYIVDTETGTFRGDPEENFLECNVGIAWAPTGNRAVVVGPVGPNNGDDLDLGLVQRRRGVPLSPDEKPPPPSQHFGGWGWDEQKEEWIKRFKPFLSQHFGGCGWDEERGVAYGEALSFNGWSPDGKWVLYTGSACGEEGGYFKYTLYLWEVDTGRREKLLSNAGRRAAWSPDGAKIAFLLFGEPRYDAAKRLIGTDLVANTPVRVYVGVMEAATRAVSTLVPLEEVPQESESNWDVHHSTDVATFSWQTSRSRESESNWDVHWSPDSKQLTMQDGAGNLSLIQADGKNVRPITRGMRGVRVSWSPDGQWLALWPMGIYEGDVGSGLERFLPPVGKEDAALSDVEIIERYFQKVLAVAPEVLGTYTGFLTDYARTLEEMGKVEAAEEQYRKAIELAQTKGDTEIGIEVMNSYVFFLCRQGRGKEAAEVIASDPALRQSWERSGNLEDFLAGLDLGTIGQFWERDLGQRAESPYGEGKKAEAQGGSEPATAPPSPVPLGADLIGADLTGYSWPRRLQSCYHGLELCSGTAELPRASCLELAVHAPERVTAPPPPPERATAPPPLAPHQPPSLYIVKVPEKSEINYRVFSEPQQSLSSETETVRKYIQEMIFAARAEGGGEHEEDILEAKRRVEEADLKGRLPRGNRKNARTLNERGLTYLNNKQFAEAVRAFQEASQADPADVEIVNNLGYARMRNDELAQAEQALLGALALSPGRSDAWANLAQTYAKQGGLVAAVACFANAYRFSRDQNKTYQFLQKLVGEDDDARVRNAATQALQLGLVRAGRDKAPIP